MAILLLFFYSCGSDTPDPQPGDNLAETRKAIAENTAMNIVIPVYDELRQRSETLQLAADLFTANPNGESLSGIRSALRDAWLTWQSASIYLFGPAEELGLRNALNTYPTDVDKITSNIETGGYILGSIDNRAAIGFPAIDYLIHGIGETDSEIIAHYDTDPLATERGTYLIDIIDFIHDRSTSVLDGWLASGGDFQGDFTNDDASGTDSGSALSLVVNAMDIHYQRFVRDGKIAIPAGIRSAGVPRPLTVEALYGSYSVELLVESLQAYRRLYMGNSHADTDGSGLYDYLVLLDAPDLAEDIMAQFDLTITMAAGLTDPLSELIENDLDQVTDVFLEMQKIVPLIKSDMASRMGIVITNQDNDGD